MAILRIQSPTTTCTVPRFCFSLLNLPSGECWPAGGTSVGEVWQRSSLVQRSLVELWRSPTNPPALSQNESHVFFYFQGFFSLLCFTWAHRQAPPFTPPLRDTGDRQAPGEERHLVDMQMSNVALVYSKLALFHLTWLRVKELITCFFFVKAAQGYTPAGQSTSLLQDLY